MGGKHFAFPCTVSLNGFAVSTYSLIDTGANGFVFIDEKFAHLLSSKLGWKIEKLPFPSLPVKGYDGKQSTHITSFLRIHLTLDGRKIYNVPFLVLPIGSHDMIIGKSFMEYFEISPNVAKRTLHWPPNHPKTSNVISQGIQVPRRILQRPPSRNHHQLDMEARDKLIELDEKRRRAGRNSTACVATSDSGYDSEDIVKVNAVDSEAAIVDFPTPGWEIKNVSTKHPRLTTVADFPTPGWKINHDPTESRKPLYTDTATQTDFDEPQRTPGPSSCPDPQEPVHHATAPKPRLRPDLTRHSHEIDHRDSLKRMHEELTGSLGTAPSIQKYQKVTVEDEPLNFLESPYLAIHEISAAAFQLCTRRQDHEVFTTSLYEIDRLLEDAYAYEAIPDPMEEQRQAQIAKASELAGITQNIAYAKNQVQQTPTEDEFARLPARYQEYRDVASKTESDKLAPHRSYDHRIELEKDASTSDLKFHPLYRMSSEELEVVKKYLVENLDKGFIESSQAPFAAPVLFTKKPDGSLRFCIDFRKLNLLTKKDRYPLPLIDETLARIGRAKLFTKLDIRQAFHRIRIHPDSEELTTFRTRFGAYKCKVLLFGLTNGLSIY